MKTKNFCHLTLVILIVSGCSTVQSAGENSSGTNSFIETPFETQNVNESFQATSNSATATPAEHDFKTIEAEASTDNLGNPLILLIEYWYSRILVQDINTGKYREIYYQDPFRFWGWAENGCELFIGPMGNYEGSILRIDLHGNVIEEVTKFDWDDFGGITQGGTVSPSEETISYILGTYSEIGLREPDVFDLYISLISNPKLIINLTQNGGAFEAVWSSTGSSIAFTGYDENGVHQLFTANPDGTERAQLTSFEEFNNEIRQIAWSPDDKRIGFYYGHLKDEEETGLESVFIVRVDEPESEPLIIQSIYDEKISFVTKIWWDEDTVLAADIRTYHSGLSNGGIYLIDVNSKEISTRLLQSETPEKTWSGVQIFGEQIGFFVGGFLWVYDLENDIFYRVENSVYGMSYSVPTPESFRGEQNCIP